MEKPFKDFGKRLKEIRERSHKSLLEVSGAVEHDPEYIQMLEEGIERPSEELLVLLVSHFELEESEAISLWKLAGYGPNSQEGNNQHKVTSVYLPLPDAKIVYTDMVNVSANKFGVTINFLQGLGSDNQPMAVSRVGMSIEHAESFLRILTETIHKVKKEGSSDKKPPQIT